MVIFWHRSAQFYWKLAHIFYHVLSLIVLEQKNNILNRGARAVHRKGLSPKGPFTERAVHRMPFSMGFHRTPLLGALSPNAYRHTYNSVRWKAIVGSPNGVWHCQTPLGRGRRRRRRRGRWRGPSPSSSPSPWQRLISSEGRCNLSKGPSPSPSLATALAVAVVRDVRC